MNFKCFLCNCNKKLIKDTYSHMDGTIPTKASIANLPKQCVSIIIHASEQCCSIKFGQNVVSISNLINVLDHLISTTCWIISKCCTCIYV